MSGEHEDRVGRGGAAAGDVGPVDGKGPDASAPADGNASPGPDASPDDGGAPDAGGAPDEGDALPESAAEYWDGRYAGSERMWSGRPNAVLVREAADLKPGRALDLGCGEGADAVWLAARGWSVVAADISQVALERAEEHARDAGLGGAIHWQRHDLTETFPSGSFDLVSAHFFHSPFEMPRERILRQAASAVAPGGVLLVVGHAAFPQGHPHADAELPTPQQVYDQLEVRAEAWELLTAEEHEQEYTDREGQPAVRRDNVLKLRRLSM